MPEILRQHDKDTHAQQLKEFKQEMFVELKDELAIINDLQRECEILSMGSKDVLREKIMAIYHSNKHNRTLFWHEKEALDQYYKDYKAMGGNSYIDRRYNRMLHWEIIEEDDMNDDR